MTRRYGRFSVPIDWVKNNVPQLKTVMAQVAIYRADHRYDLDRIEYFAASDYFRELAEGEAAPEYRWILGDMMPQVEEVKQQRGLTTPMRQLLNAVGELPVELQADLETGSHHMNNRASEEFAKRYHRLMKQMNEVQRLANVIEEMGE